MRHWLIDLIARVPASVHTKLLAAFLTMVVLLITDGEATRTSRERANRAQCRPILATVLARISRPKGI